MAQTGSKYCEKCKTKSHNTSDCWGPSTFCGKLGHKSEYCRTNPQNEGSSGSAQTTGMANTAKEVKEKKKKKKKYKKLGKAAAEKPEETQATAEMETVEEESEDEASEEDSPVKQTQNNRAARVGLPCYSKVSMKNSVTRQK